MGSFYGWNSRKEVIAECLKLAEGFKVVAHTCVGNNLWFIYEKALEGGKVERVIGLCCIGCHGPKNDKDWGYKPMDESAGPIYYNCPLSYLELAQPMRDCKDSREWREKVKTYWKQKADGAKLAKTLPVGTKVKSRLTGHEFFFVRDYSRTFVLVKDDKDKLWRIKKADMEVLENADALA